MTTKREIYAHQATYLRQVWQDQGSPPLRTIAEVAVGPWSLLAPYEKDSERALFIEPDPEMADAARINYPWAEVHQVAIMESYGTVNLRKLKGSSYVKGIGWAPAFDAFPERARAAGKVAVTAVPFSIFDDGKIDMINLDCEGSEWFVLRTLISRPRFLQIELYPKHAHLAEITGWLALNGYHLQSEWGNANRIYLRDEVAAIPRQLHQIWVSPDGGEIPDSIYLPEWRESWKALHPDWEYSLWNDEALNRLVAEFHPEFREVWDKARAIVKADLARLLILHHHGGLYVDLDYLALRPLDRLLDGARLALPAFSDGYLVNALVAAVPGHPLLLQTAREGVKRWRASPGARPEVIFGQEAMMKIFRGQDFTALKAAEVCPIDWRDPTAEDLAGDVYAVTRWAHNWL